MGQMSPQPDAARSASALATGVCMWGGAEKFGGNGRPSRSVMNIMDQHPPHPNVTRYASVSAT
eukprot:310525-Chlamydomonas_euryale.AAC.1